MVPLIEDIRRMFDPGKRHLFFSSHKCLQCPCICRRMTTSRSDVASWCRKNLTTSERFCRSPVSRRSVSTPVVRILRHHYVDKIGTAVAHHGTLFLRKALLSHKGVIFEMTTQPLAPARLQTYLQHIYRRIRRNARIWFESSAIGFRVSLKIRRATGPHGNPEAPWHNAVLKTTEEAGGALRQVHKLGLPPIRDLPKNWDSLAALDVILRRTAKDARVFDAGGELYSMILQWLYLYGYRNLSAGNLVFRKPIRKGPIVYHYSDITDTGFDSGLFDAITCLSVIEHGVDLPSYFREMSRILKPGGVLVTSTDYFESPVDTQGQVAYGVPIHIFDKSEIVDALEIARTFGLVLISPLDLGSNEKVITWGGRHHLCYTFVVISLQKTEIARGS